MFGMRFYNCDFFKEFNPCNILLKNFDLLGAFSHIFNVITFETDVRQSTYIFDNDKKIVYSNNPVELFSDNYNFLRSLGNFYQTFFLGESTITFKKKFNLSDYNTRSLAEINAYYMNLNDVQSFKSFFYNVDYVQSNNAGVSNLESNFFFYTDLVDGALTERLLNFYFTYGISYLIQNGGFFSEKLLQHSSEDMFFLLFISILCAIHQLFFYILNLFINNAVIAPIFNVLFILITNICLMLIVTLIIAALTLIERKFLSLTQRRVGPYYVGYRGRLQYIADALKLFLKGATVHNEANKFWFYAVPSVCCVICYFFWMNSIWCPSVSLLEIEYNLVYATLLSVSFGFCIILLGYFSGNKYSRLASIRAAVAMLNLELFLGLMMLSLVFISESFCLSVFVVYQETIWLIFTFFGMCGLISLTFMLEVARTPFDVAEAESELVTGYSTEIGSFMFGIYYLGEYFHLFFFSAVISILFLGGWEAPNFLFYLVLPTYLPY